jgi:hypothetical protein
MKALVGSLGWLKAFFAGNHYVPSNQVGISVTAPEIVRVQLFVVFVSTRNWKASLRCIGENVAHRTVSWSWNR